MSGPLASTQLPFFNPRSLSGCVLWLDGADSSSMALTGSVITSWRDKSGQGNNATAFNSPTLSGSNVTMNGTNQYFTCPNVSYRPCNIFCVATYTGSGESTLLRKGYTNGNTYEFSMAILTTSTLRYEIRTSGGGQININPTVASTSGIQMYEMTYDNTTGTAYFNATSVGTGTATGPIFSGASLLFLGVVPSDGNTPFTGYFAGSFQEFIIYTTPPTTLQRQQVEGYLAWKWGLRAKLPDNHPYKNIPVYPNPPVPFSPVVPNTTNNAVFTPLQIANCALWLDATDPNANSVLPANGSAVASWIDKSGSNNSAVSFGSTPTFFRTSSYTNLPFIQFNATNWANTQVTGVNVMSLPNFQNTASVSVFYVCLGNATYYPANAMRPLFVIKGVFGGAQVYLETQVASVGISLGSPSFYNTISSTGVGNRVFMNSAIYDDAAKVFNGGQNGSNSSFSVGTSGWLTTMSPTQGTASVGAYFDTISRGFQNLAFNGELYEIIAFNSALSTAQRQQVEGYLAWKWGLTASLPNGHPFKTPPLAPFSYALRRALNATWNPLSLSGAVLWLDARDTSTIVSSGTSVTRWNDKSPSAMNATPSNANIFLTSSSNFTGVYINNNNNGNAPGTTNLTLSSNFMTTSNYTIFATFQFTSAALYQTLFSDTRTTGDARIQLGETQSFDVLADGTTLRAMTFTLGTSRQQICATTSSNGIFFYQNGSLIGSNTTTGAVYTTDAGGLPTIGGPSQSPPDNRFMTGWMFEMIIYSSVLSLQQRQQVEGYLAWKWGVQGSLPAGHPFRNIPPAP